MNKRININGEAKLVPKRRAEPGHCFRKAPLIRGTRSAVSFLEPYLHLDWSSGWHTESGVGWVLTLNSTCFKPQPAAIQMDILLDYRCAGAAQSFPTKICAIEISPDGSLVAMASAGKLLAVFELEDLTSGAAASITVDCSAEIHSLAWSASCTRIFSGLSDGTLTVASMTPVSAFLSSPTSPLSTTPVTRANSPLRVSRFKETELPMWLFVQTMQNNRSSWLQVRTGVFAFGTIPLSVSPGLALPSLCH